MTDVIIYSTLSLNFCISVDGFSLLFSFSKHFLDCNDECPSDATKSSMITCYGDDDGDGHGDPNIYARACECASLGYVEDDTDSCPQDPDKQSPGACGCGISDADSDLDGTPDCHDDCPTDPNKTEPGECGCAFCPRQYDGYRVDAQRLSWGHRITSSDGGPISPMSCYDWCMEQSDPESVDFALFQRSNYDSISQEYGSFICECLKERENPVYPTNFWCQPVFTTVFSPRYQASAGTSGWPGTETRCIRVKAPDSFLPSATWGPVDEGYPDVTMSEP